VRPLAVVGNLSRDLVDGESPRVGGAPFHAARALRVLGRPALVAAKCAEADRRLLVPPLVRLGVPVLWRAGESTAAFSFHYDGDRRHMVVEEVGPRWSPADLRGLERADWVHVGALARSDFPAETLGELARNRRVSLDGQGLVRGAKEGPLELDGDFDRSLLEHVTVLKLADDEAAVIDDPISLGVPELLLTHGSRGATVYAVGRKIEVPARAVPRDATGAGDAFCAVYLASRADGLAPASAARRATTAVAALIR